MSLKLEPIAFARDLDRCIMAVEKKRLMKYGQHGGELAQAAKRAEEFNIPLYAIPEGYEIVPVDKAK